MREALREARRAGRRHEVPVGAVVVWEREAEDAIARGHNLCIARRDPTAHAEVVAIRRACRLARNYRLPGATLYVTLEPCLMCLGAIAQARVSRVVYGASDPKRGAASAARTRRIAAIVPHRVCLEGGLLAAECGALLRDFFRARR